MVAEPAVLEAVATAALSVAAGAAPEVTAATREAGAAPGETAATTAESAAKAESEVTREAGVTVATRRSSRYWSTSLASGSAPNTCWRPG